MMATQCNPAGMKVKTVQRSSVLAWIAAVVIAVLFIAAGIWQLARAHYKDILAQRYATLATTMLPAEPTRDGDGMRVVVRGNWLAKHTVWIDNRTHAGRAGIHFLTPLVLVDGRWLFVDRGWVPLDGRRSLPEPPPLVLGDVTVEGHLVTPAEGFHLGAGPATGRLWPRIDPDSMRQLAAGVPVYPAVLQLEQGASDGLVRDWAPSTMSGDRHRAYAVQWFSFAAIVLGLMVWVIRRRLFNED